MIEINLENGGKVKVWNKKNDFIVKLMANTFSKKYAISGECSDATLNDTIIIEAFLPRGGRYIYGALGA